MCERELLRDRTAERHAEHVGLGMAECVEQVRGLAGQAVHPQWNDTRGGDSPVPDAS